MTNTETATTARHLEILAAMDSRGEIEASREVPYATLAAMARRGLVTIHTRRQDMIGTDPRPYKLARITDAGRAALVLADADAGITEDAELADVLGDDMPTEDEPEMSTAEIMARVTGSVGATVVESRVATDGTRTELSRHSWSRPQPCESEDPREAVWCDTHNPVGTPATAQTAHALAADCTHPHYAGAPVQGPDLAEYGLGLCDGGSRRCEGLVTDPAHVAAARAGDLSAFPYCGPCRVAAAGDAAMDEPVQGPDLAEYGLGLYRLRGALLWSTPDGTALKSSAITPGEPVAVTAVTTRDGAPTLRVMRVDGEHGLALTRKFHEAGPDRL